MWIYERCRKEWKDEAAANQKDMTCLGHAELIAEAMKQPAFQSIINPDDTCFANPSSMVEAIKQYCEKTGQHVPQSYGEFCRCIFESLALRYRQVFTCSRISPTSTSMCSTSSVEVRSTNISTSLLPTVVV